MQQKGFITILVIIIVGSIATVIGLSFTAWSLTNIKSSQDYYWHEKAKALSLACAETALQEIRNLTSYSGSATLTIDNGSCSYTVTNTGGSNRKIDASGTINGVIRKNQIIIDQINPIIHINSWQEVGDF